MGDEGTRTHAAGSLIGERYVLGALIGEGAAGEVWLARDKDLHIDVALKVLHAKHAARREWVLAAFAREADLAERMLSPHVVKALARGLTPGGVPYIVYEHLEGVDLAARLKTMGRQSFADVRTIVVHTCRALARAHAVGALHRDVKPENLFLTRDPEGRLLVKLLDFGVAELTAQRDGTDVDRIVGTLEYLAPEVLLGQKPPSAQSDVFALGVVAFECLTGERPRKAENVGQLVAVFASGTMPSASALRPDIPAEVEAWLVRATSPDLEVRFTSAKEAAEMFEIAVQTAPTYVEMRTNPRVLEERIGTKGGPKLRESESRMRPRYSSSYQIIAGEDDEGGNGDGSKT